MNEMAVIDVNVERRILEENKVEIIWGMLKDGLWSGHILRILFSNWIFGWILDKLRWDNDFYWKFWGEHAVTSSNKISAWRKRQALLNEMNNSLNKCSGFHPSTSLLKPQKSIFLDSTTVAFNHCQFPEKSFIPKICGKKFIIFNSGFAKP